MTYTPATPQPQTLPSSDQDDFLTNFQLLNQFFSEDHIAFDAVSGNGNHKKITLNKPLTEGPMTPASGIVPNSSAVFTKQRNLSETSRSSLYFQNAIGSTAENLLTTLSFVKGDNKNGFGVVTPWGLILNFGQVFDQTTQVQPSTNFDFPIPYTTAIYSLINCAVFSSILDPLIVYNFTNVVSLTQFNSKATNIAALPTPTWYLAVGK